MKFRITKTETKKMKAFGKREWIIADKEHSGQSGEWPEERAYISVFEKGKILGILYYVLGAGVMEIETIIVSSKYRKQGIGSALMQKAEAIARKKEAHKLYLLTGKNWQAVKLYKKLCFRRTGRLSNHYLRKNWVAFSKLV